MSFASTLITVSFLTALFSYLTRRPMGQLPGPRGVPFLNNLFQVPTSHPWLRLTKWARKYGGVYQFSVFNHAVVVVSSAEGLHQLGEQKAGIYADRPVMPVSGEMLGYQTAVPMITYGDEYKNYRKLMQHGLSASKTNAYTPIRQQLVVKLVNDLMDSSAEFDLIIRNSIAAIAMGFTHGYRPEPKDDFLIRSSNNALSDWSEATAITGIIAQLLPFRGRSKHETMLNVSEWPYRYVQDQLAKGSAPASYLAELIESAQDISPADKQAYKWTSSSLFLGALDNTTYTLTKFVLAMVLYPEVQRKAQEELDAVIGSSRMPELSDRSDLPYIQKIVSELWRWHPSAPLAAPHRLMEDDVYNGCHIKAGSTVLFNTWGICHDETLYPSPEVFNPDRYDVSTPELNPDPSRYAFGYGRRVCPAKKFGEETAFLVTSNILHTLNITGDASRFDTSDIYKFAYQFGTGITSAPPTTFKYSITPRSKSGEALVRSARACDDL